MSRPSLLVLRALGMGDLLVTVPALRGLRSAYPRHRLVLAAPAWLAPLAGLIDAVDELLDHPGLERLPDVAPEVAVNLHGKGPQSHQLLDALAPARRIGHACLGWPGPRWRDDLPERQRWCVMLGWHGVPADPEDGTLPAPAAPAAVSGAAVIHPSAAYGAKRWPPERFAAVARELTDRGLPVVLTGSAADRPLATRVAAAAELPARAVLAGRLGLAELAALVSSAAVLVCGDTGIAHLASAYRIPSVVLFGPVPAWRWAPPADGPHRALSADTSRQGDAFAGAPDPALLGVTVSDVLAAVGELAPTAPPGTSYTQAGSAGVHTPLQ